MTNDQLSAIRDNVGGPSTCERWARYWSAKGRECTTTDDADVCYGNAQTLLAAAQAMRVCPVEPVLIAGGVK